MNGSRENPQGGYKERTASRVSATKAIHAQAPLENNRQARAIFGIWNVLQIANQELLKEVKVTDGTGWIPLQRSSASSRIFLEELAEEYAPSKQYTGIP